MPKIAQAYIHLVRNPDPEIVQDWGRYAENLSYRIAKEVYGFEVELLVDIEPGSLKIWITAMGLTVLPTYELIANYKGFKEGLAEMTRDARSFAGEFNKIFLKQISAPPSEVVRRERRTKTPGKLLKTLDRLEWLEHRIQQVPPEQISKELRTIRRSLENVLGDVSPQDEGVIKQILEREHQPRLPEPIMPKMGIRRTEVTMAFEEEPSRLVSGPGGLRPRLSYRGSFWTSDPPPVPFQLPPPPYRSEE